MNRFLPETSAMAMMHRVMSVPMLLLTVCLLLTNFSFAQQGHAPWVGSGLDGVSCEGKGQGYGPYDYLQRGTFAANLKLVEDHHFTPDIEQLTRRSRDSLASNLDYTLRAWPNHHRALSSMMRFRSKGSVIESVQLRSVGIPPVECYFSRAIHFSPSDATARMLLAMLFQNGKRYGMAHEAYEKALEIEPANLQIQYNFALLLTDMKQYERARYYAGKVYAADFPLPGLRRKLERAGAW